MAADEASTELKMDLEGLYLEEVFTDRRVGSILRLTPVDGEGRPDPNRDTIYVGQTQVLTPAGPLPLSFEIEAKSLAEAAQAFGDAARKAVEDTMEKLQELRREAASSLIVRGSSAGFGGPEGLTGSGFPPPPGGGKIQLR